MTGISELYDIRPNFIDKDALGFSARVTKAISLRTGDDVAIKVLRLEHLDDAEVWGRFSTESKLLHLLKEQPAIVNFSDCGYLSDVSQSCPTNGEIISLGTNVEEFSENLAKYRKKRWRPYLALELIPAKHSLLMLIRGANGDNLNPIRLPTEEGINLALQFLEILVEMHRNDAIYVDHKPEHVYWDGQQLRIIDFNVSMFLEKESSLSVKALGKQEDLRNFIKGVLYTVFTGRDFRYQNQNRAPTAAPSDPKAVREKFSLVDHLDFGMQETLLPQLVELMNHSMTDPKLNAEGLLDGFQNCAAMLGWSSAKYPASSESILARKEILIGLSALREAQQKLQEARNHFLEAGLHNPADKEGSRLYLETSAFYQKRVLP